MADILKELISIASKHGVRMEINAGDQGLDIVVRKEHGTFSEPVEKSTSLWIDKNEEDMMGRLDHFILLVR